VHVRPVCEWFAHGFVPGPGCGLVCSVLSSRARACRRNRQVPRVPLPDVGVTSIRETCSASSEDITPRSSLLQTHAPIPLALLSFGYSPRRCEERNLRYVAVPRTQSGGRSNSFDVALPATELADESSAEPCTGRIPPALREKRIAVKRRFGATETIMIVWMHERLK